MGTESAAAAAQLLGRQEKGVTALRRCYVVKNLTTCLEIVLGSVEVPGPQRFHLLSVQATGSRCTKLSGK